MPLKIKNYKLYPAFLKEKKKKWIEIILPKKKIYIYKQKLKNK
jgi:hypothetical protein